MSTLFEIALKLREEIVDSMDDYINEVVVIGSIDVGYGNASRYTPRNPLFCIINHGGGDLEQGNRTFDSNNVWKHKLMVHFYIPVTAVDKLQEHEYRLFAHYDEFTSKMAAKRHCMGENSSMEVGRAYVPEVWTVAEQAYSRLTYRLDIKQQL